jgi:hypothetical protein
MFDAVMMRVPQCGAITRGNPGRGSGAVTLPSSEPAVAAGTVPADGVGATEALISNPVDERKIAATNKNIETPQIRLALLLASVPKWGLGWCPYVTHRNLRSRSLWQLPAVARTYSLSQHLTVRLTKVNASDQARRDREQ